MQQANLSIMQQNGSVITEQVKTVENVNEYSVTESSLSIRDDNNKLLNKEENRRQTEKQATINNHAKNESISVSRSVQNIYKKSPGRPKKTEVIILIIEILFFFSFI